MIREYDFFKRLVADKRPTFIPFLRKDGPIITLENQQMVVETIMLDYFKKKLEIQAVMKDYESDDLDVLLKVEEDVLTNVGSRIKIMHFYPYDGCDADELEERLIELEKDPEFVSWAVK